MGKVKELDPRLVSKIAAGEVIERPASVVKELVENSLDAGATRVEVAIERGGLERIIVSDDGEGMTPEDLRLAIRRHTTSKISTEADLERVTSLGFRGEALASIVEVAKVTITTRAREAALDLDLDSAGSPDPGGAGASAVRLTVEGGVGVDDPHLAVEPAARAPGTTVEVCELFYNVPARRKHLRSEKTERYQILRVMKRFILAWPLVHFTLKSDGRKVLEVPPTPELRERVAALYGPKLARSLVEVDEEGLGPVRVFGLISRPSSRATAPTGGRFARERRRTVRTSQEQFIFINGRWVRDPGLNQAITQAYESVAVASPARPMVFLFLELPPELVDVNVHPRKEEVRFADQQLVQAQVKRALQRALLSHKVVPKLELKLEPEPELEPGRRQEAKPRLQLDLKRELAEARLELHHRPRQRRQEQPSPESSPRYPPPEEEFQVLGQLHHTYILVQTEEGLELIDQHVAHERVLYERFLEQITNGAIGRQRLLIPLTLEFPPEEAELLAENLPLLESLGLGLEPFGRGSFLLREWPEVLAERLTEEEAHEALERLMERLRAGERPERGELVEELAAELACAAALKKNTPLTPEEMEALVRQLKNAGNPYTCPHGRPIVVKYTLEELERHFNRR